MLLGHVSHRNPNTQQLEGVDIDNPGSALDRYPTAESFMAMLKTGKRPDGSDIDPFMPWKALGHFSDTELDALWELPPRRADTGHT